MKSSQFHYASFFGILFFLACAAFSFLISTIMGFSALANIFYDGATDPQTTILFISQGFIGVLFGAAATFSFLRFLNKPYADDAVSTSIRWLNFVFGIIIAGAVLLLGDLVQDNQTVNWLILPLLTVPAVALPIWLIFRLGINDLPLGSRWRLWSSFGLSMSVTPFFLFILEIVVIFIILIIFIVYVMTNPQLSIELQNISDQFINSTPEPEEAIRILTPFLSKPGVLIVVFSLFSFIVPLIEEAFKPLVVWLLVGKLTSKAQGFALGALSGAGFALVETINVSLQADGWSEVLFARIGTGAMHITASALMGAAIVSAFQEKSFLRLFGTYLFAVLLHGTWNAIAVTNGFSSILSFNQPDRAQTLLATSTIALAVLTVGLIIILVSSNRLHYKNNNNDISNAASTIDDEKNI